MSEEELKSVKVVLLGESGVGKTCIISRFINNIYDDRTMTTSSAQYATKTMKFDDFGGKEIRYELWDTAGQERFRAITQFLYKDAKVIILVYDITEKESFREKLLNILLRQDSDRICRNVLIKIWNIFLNKPNK